MNLTDLANQTRFALKSLAYETPMARWVAHRWQYNFSPAQLGFLCSCLDRTREVAGPVFEVGCFAGVTTVYLNKHMSAEGIEKPYYAFDTFGGFTADDVAYESEHRGKQRSRLAGFTDNRPEWFKVTMALNGVSRVRAVQADVNTYDFSALEAPSFCLLDVDLYRPVRSVLEALYDRLPTGAIVVVDDCMSGTDFDGALSAYREFVAARGLPERIVHHKLGVIEKP
jgi:predicted O-methyltransferase YrrM